MIVYHMSDTLKVGEELTPDYKKYWELTKPFVLALERGRESFYGAYFAAKHMDEVLDRFGMADLRTDCDKWAAEGVFEYVRRHEFPDCCCRLRGNYYFDDIASCRGLYEADWGRAPAEERAKIRLFEVELSEADAVRHDMRFFDLAYDDIWERGDVENTLRYARSYFSGESTPDPVWEIVSDRAAVALRDVTGLLRPEDAENLLHGAENGQNGNQNR